MWQDTKNKYGAISKLLHWGMALLIIQQFFKFAGRINDNQHWLGETFGPWHASIGFTILLLVVVRLLWVAKQWRQRPVTPGLIGLAAKLGHVGLYLCMLAMPLTGIAFLVGNGYGLKVFGSQLIAGTGEETAWLLNLGSLHSPLAWLFALLVVGHIGAALVHHFKFADDTLKRML